MKSTSGAHFIALDHVRALAAFMVFTWHFIHHGGNVALVPMDYTPAIFPLALLDEGHVGVALFMTLSGYLFAKLLDGKSIDYKRFLWNRILRLFPLLAVVILIGAIAGYIHSDAHFFSYVYYYTWYTAKGAILPTLPNGGWSITVELHYYAILPLFLWMIRKSKWMPISIILAAVALRSLIYHERGEIQSLAYWTIIGRVDQFALGMFMFQFRDFLARRHVIAIATMTVFATFYWYLDLHGGAFQAPKPLWILLPTIEGLACAVSIAWYESSFLHSTNGISSFIGRIGKYSYSIYLLHAFVVFIAATFVTENIMYKSNFYVACLWSLVAFLLMVPIGYLSFRFIEAPFLKLRKRYVVSPSRSQGTPPQLAQQSEQAELKCAAEL